MTVSVKPKGRSLSFPYGNEKIRFNRVPRPATEDSVLIKVHPDCSVVVAAPDSASDDVVLAAAKKRQRWIYQKISEFREQKAHVVPRSYNSGEGHLYLGKRYQLKVLTSKKRSQGVKLLRGALEVTVPRKNAESVRNELKEWYRDRAKYVFNARLDAVLEQALWVPEKPSLNIRVMNSQWGSCSPEGKVLLNLNLIKAPRDCIDYVILHELCHIAEHNHSEKFYRLMKQVMPNWESTKFRLDGLAGNLLQ